MTLVRDLSIHNGSLGRLIISPAVEPSEKPESSVPGYGASKLNAAGTQTQQSDVLTGIWNGTTLPTGLLLSFQGPGPNEKWKVERCSIGSVSNDWESCQVHAGDYNAANEFQTLVDNSVVPATDIADENSPIFVAPGQRLSFLFVKGTGTAAAGSDATARIQYTKEILPSNI